MWLRGLGLRIVASLVGLFIVPAIKHQPISGGWSANAFLVTFMINGVWGVGVDLPLWLLMRQPLRKPV